VSVLQMIGPRLAIKAWASGTSIDSEDTLKFSVLTDVRSMNEEFDLDKANDAYERMMSGKAKFRVVLKTGN
jgi:alcohol dehydrogenase